MSLEEAESASGGSVGEEEELEIMDMDEGNTSIESTEESDSDEEDEKEPQLKFERLGNDLLNILDKDSVSCVAVHPKVLLLYAGLAGHLFLCNFLCKTNFFL